MEPVVIPAILVKSRADLLLRIGQVAAHVPQMQIDIMDGRFVPNTTIGLDQLHDLPQGSYEFHWMVLSPEDWIARMPGPHLHMVHVETVASIDRLEEVVRASGGRLGLAICPDTPLAKLLPVAPRAERLLVMTVRPGFSGQSYLPQMEHRIKELRAMFPDKDIEVDGGVNPQTIGRAYGAGANILAAASAIFSSDDVAEAVRLLKERAKEGEGS